MVLGFILGHIPLWKPLNIGMDFTVFLTEKEIIPFYVNFVATCESFSVLSKLQFERYGGIYLGEGV